MPHKKFGVCKIKLPASISGRLFKRVFIYITAKGANLDA
jgi:hypothetical protein